MGDFDDQPDRPLWGFIVNAITLGYRAHELAAAAETKTPPADG